MFRHTALTSLAIAATVALVFPVSTHAQEVLDGAVAAVVNGDVVTFSEVRELVGRTERQLRESLKGDALADKIKEIRLAAINDLIDRAVVLQTAKAQRFTIPETMIDDRLDEIVRQSFNGDLTAFLHSLAVQGFTPAKFREHLRDTIVVEEMRREATDGLPAASDQEVQDYYREHAEEHQKPMKDVRPEIEKRLLQDKRQKKLQEWMLGLRKKAFIKIY